MLVKRSGSAYWYCRFTAPDGRRVFQTTRTADKRQAQEYEARLKARLWREQQLGESQAIWPEAVVSWLKSTTHKDRRNVEQRLRWLDAHLGGLALREINAQVLHRIRSEKLADGVSAATVNRHLAIVSAVLRHAQKAGWIESVPAIPRMKEPEGRIRYLSPDEAQQLIDRLTGHMKDMVEFALATGLREQNICGLAWDRVDMARRLAWVAADSSKSGKPIRAPLGEWAVQVLARRQGIHPEWVFTYRGRKLTRCNNTAFRAAIADIGWTDVSFHTLRHTWASRHVMNGTPLQALKELGGWSDLRMVLRYAHLADDFLAGYADNSGAGIGAVDEKTA